MPSTDNYTWDSSKSSDYLGGGAFGNVFKVKKNYLKLLANVFVVIYKIIFYRVAGPAIVMLLRSKHLTEQMTSSLLSTSFVKQKP